MFVFNAAEQQDGRLIRIDLDRLLRAYRAGKSDIDRNVWDESFEWLKSREFVISLQNGIFQAPSDLAPSIRSMVEQMEALPVARPDKQQILSEIAELF
jgi:hypothetical protein